jgi:hypothetical protein
MYQWDDVLEYAKLLACDTVGTMHIWRQVDSGRYAALPPEAAAPDIANWRANWTFCAAVRWDRRTRTANLDLVIKEESEEESGKG